MARPAFTYRAARRNKVLREARLVWNEYAYYNKAKTRALSRRIKNDPNPHRSS